MALYFYNNKLSHYEGGQWNFGEICYLKVYFCQLEDKGHVHWLIWGRPNLHMHLGKLSHYELSCLTSNLCGHWIWCSVQRRFKCYFCSQSGSLRALYCNLHKDLALRSNLIFFCSPVIFFLRKKGIYPLDSIIQQLELGVYGVNILPI